MILEAFSHYLQAADQELPATWILARWLWERLSVPPETNVDRVLHAEIALSTSSVIRGRLALKLDAGKEGPTYTFRASSSSGESLLRSLHQYALSFEQQKWARWVHFVKASDFNQRFDNSA